MRILFLLALTPVWAGELRIGRAVVNITPPVGAPMGSSYGITVSTGVHDDLFAKALVLDVDGVRAAMVSCDLISVRRPIVAEARRLIERETGLRGGQVILSATHCHAGPQMSPIFLALVPEPARRLGEQYAAALPARIAESVRLAASNLTPARAWVHIGREEHISFNRRFLLKDGTVVMNPGRGNPDIVRPVGPIDPDVAVVYFDSPQGKPLATYVNFALHVAIAGGSLFSSDFPHVLADALAAVRGPDMLTMFTNGMSGNVNHVDVHDPAGLNGYPQVARIGTILAADVLRAYRHLEPVSTARLQTRTEKVDLPTPHYRAEEVERARGIVAKYGRRPGPAFLDVVHAWKVIDVAALDGKPLETEVQAITLGDELAWVGMPGDAFTELGLAIKTNSPFRHTIVSEQSGGGAISYVPNRKAFPEGAYEVISARFTPGGAETLVDRAVQSLIGLKEKLKSAMR
jgi:hypothetical protein